jgi:23S rRNA (uracil1939-C5)-methyltransferase
MAARRAARRAAFVTDGGAQRTLQIERLVAGGDGLARDDGMVVFVPRSIPGELVTATPVKRGRVMRALPERVVQGAASRVEPRCAHFLEGCGGCQWQHMDGPAQRAAKQALIVEAFARIAKRHIEPPVVMAAPSPWRYRRKLTFALRRRGTQWIAGLHRADAPGVIVPITDCLITDERVLAVWREVLAVQRWFPPTDTGRAAVRVYEDGSASLVFEGGDHWPQARRLFEAVPSLRSLWWQPTLGRRRRLAQRDRAGVDDAAFVQVNAEVTAALREHVTTVVAGILAESAGAASAPVHVVDAYAGSGDGAHSLAALGARVTAIEADPDAAAVASARLAAPSRVITGTVEGRLAEALPAAVLVVNPPRTGLHEAVPALILAAGPALRAVVYTSCDPATLARDVARLPGWQVRAVRAFDMFPQTAHVEAVCLLLPESTP